MGTIYILSLNIGRKTEVAAWQNGELHTDVYFPDDIVQFIIFQGVMSELGVFDTCWDFAVITSVVFCRQTHLVHVSTF